MSRSKKPTKIDLPLIQKFYEAQQKIFQEDSRHVVESFCRKEQLANLTETATESFKKEKEHFETTRTIISRSLRKKPIKEQTMTLLNIGSIKTKTVKMPGLLDLTVFLLNKSISIAKLQKDKDKDAQSDLVDLLTFSIIPSYLNFFWVDSSIKKLVKYFFLMSQNSAISIDQYNQLARSAFVTPSFLLYSFYAFQPIFSKLLNYSDKNINNFFKDNFSQGNFPGTISKFNYMIPKEVFAVLICSKQQASTFLNAFFNIAFSSPDTMHIYNLLHFSQIPSKDVLKAIKTYFSSDPNIINLIIKAMTNNNPCYNDLLTSFNELSAAAKSNSEYLDELTLDINDTRIYKSNEDDEDEFDNENANNHGQQTESAFFSKQLFDENDQKYCPEIFQPFIFSSQDMNLFDFFFGKTPMYVTPDRLEYFRVYSDNEVTVDNMFNVNEATMAHTDTPVPFLRHLLQFSDPLPKFKAKPSNIITVNDFIKIYLIERGDVSTYAQRKYNGDCFMFLTNNFSPPINDILKKVEFSRINDIKALSAFANIEKKLQILDGNSQESRSTMNLLLDSQKKEFAAFKDPHSDTEYFKVPKLFSDDFIAITSKYSRLLNSKENLNKIVYSKLLSNQKIDFQTFYDYRTGKLKGKQNLKKMDQDFSAVLLNDSFIQKYINESIEMNQDASVFDKGIYLKRFINTFELNYFNTGYIGKSDNYEAKVKSANAAGKGIYKENDYSECKFIGDMIIEAFQEKSLMRKIDILSHCFTKIKSELNKNFPPEKSPLAEPEFEPTICSIFMRVNPPNFYSNFVFLHDMIGSLSPEDIFVGSSRSIFNYMKLIVNHVFNENQDKINSCILFNEDEDM